MLPLENPKVTSEYVIIRPDKKLHKGIDLISMSGDRNVKAIRSGVVRVTPYDKDGFGNYISIQQEDGFRALYCHLEKVLVKPGDTIEEGQVIGVEGTSGNSTGVHLHLELRKAPYDIGDHINVAEYLKIKNQKGKVEYIESEDKIMEKRYNSVDEVPEWGRETISKIINLGILQGDENGNLNISRDMLVVFVTNDRAGLYDF